MGVLEMILLLSCWIFTGITAGDPSTTYYCLKNSTVCLKVMKPPPYFDASWKFSGKVLYSSRGIHPSYKDRVRLGAANLSICVEKLTEEDAGIYEVSFTTYNFSSVLETHQIFVQEMVPRPVMTVMSERPSNLSAGSCSVAVNCSFHGDSLWSVCDEDGCRPSLKSFGELNITIFSDNRTVVCSGNNRVSRNNVTESMGTLCVRKKTDEPQEKWPHPPVNGIVAVVLALVLLLVLVFALSLSRCKNQAATSTAGLIQSGPLEEQTQPEARASTSSCSEASYENVDVGHPRERSIPREEQFSRESQKADTVYSIPKPAASRSKSDGKKDSAGHKNTQETPASEAVFSDEPQHSTQIDTVYSLLQKPIK
ncbi:uncharacterized protein PAE49_021216 [Odontesthes bonariensis]|uniref:uncharacterized protein LOC142369126 n=1 Tax=Odontesthes bonariensis TaxID=219752 RepID=UPI003F588782